MLFFPRCFDPVAFLFFATNYFFCPFFLFLYADYSRYCFFASVFLFSFMFCVSFFHNGFLSVRLFHAVCSFFISFLSTFPLFIPSYAVFIRERSFSYICFIIFFPFYALLRPFDLFLFFFRMIFLVCYRFFVFLQALKVFWEYMLHPISEPFRSFRSLLPDLFCKRSTDPVSIWRFPFIFYLSRLFYPDSAVLLFDRRSRFLSAVSAFSCLCFGFFFLFRSRKPLLVFRLLYALLCPFSVTVHLFWIISFGLSVFQQKKAHFCAFRLFYIVFQIAFATSLMPSLFWMTCLSGFLFSCLSQPISLTGRTI